MINYVPYSGQIEIKDTLNTIVLLFVFCQCEYIEIHVVRMSQSTHRVAKIQYR